MQTSQPQNKELMEKKIWPYDAEDLRFDALKYIHPTDNIKLFLEGNGVYIVCGLKGLGKTLVLRAKRMTYLELSTKTLQSYVIIPESPQELDVLASFNQREHKWDMINNNVIWLSIWGLSIGLSIISYFITRLDDKNKGLLIWNMKQVLKVKDKRHNNYLGLLLDYTTKLKSNPSRFVTLTLNSINMNIIDANLISELYSNILGILKQDITSGCVVFIDQVDKTLEEFMTMYIDDVYKLSKLQEIWYACQIGLIQAVVAICTGHHHITIYTSIRQEVLGKISRESNIGRYEDKMLTLGYEKEDLKKIFIKSIELFEDEDNLSMPDLIESDPIKAFLGFDEVYSLRIPEQSENIFDYLYRHTIQRPRDIIILGGRISKIKPEKRYGTFQNADAIKRLINDIAENSLEIDYLGDLKKLFHLDFFRAFYRIHKNILSYKEIIELCKEYNKVVNKVVCDEKCKNCTETHLFCSLYNIGLIGIVIPDKINNIKIQKFLEPQYRKLIILGSILPNSEAYLLLSALSHLIEKIRKEGKLIFERNVGNIIVGDGREFPSNFKVGHVNEDELSDEYKMKVPPETPKPKIDDCPYI